MHSPAQQIREKINILVVDDLPEQHVVLRTILEELDENVVSVSSGREALMAVLERNFAVILLDVNMPGMDGFEAASLMRSYRRTANTPIIFITAYVDDEEMKRGYSLGAVDYISSPVVPEILRSKVRVFVDMYRMHHQLLARAAEREELVKAEARRAAAEQARQRADFLANASHVLTRSLDANTTVARILELSVPALADVALLAYRESEDSMQAIKARVAHPAGSLPHDPAGALTYDGVRLSTDLDALVQQALQGDETRTWRGARHALLALLDANGKRIEWANEFGEVVVFPLLMGAPQKAVFLLGVRKSEEGADHAALAREFVGRASIALENAFLFSAIRDADRRKNEFLAMLAHELRNPLAPIANAVGVMRGARATDADVLRWASDIIGTQVEHMVRIVDDLLDVSRIARGTVELRREAVPLTTVIERAIETSRPNFMRESQTLSFEPGPVDTVVEGDVVRLAQIVANLLNNASKFSPVGSHVSLSIGFDGTMAAISVKDEGEGIDTVFLPHVFDLFAQGDTSLDRSQGGLGIGLTLVRHLTEMHGGTVHCLSAGRGNGAEFIVRLPAHSAERGENRRAAVVPLYRKPALRILVVDDLPASAQSLEAFLRMHGYQVRCAEDGVAALKEAKAFLPHVVLLDIGLPGMSGYEVAERLRAEEAGRTSLIIALSGYSQEEHVQRSAAAGMDHHLVKPADLTVLLELIAGYGRELGPNDRAAG